MALKDWKRGMRDFGTAGKVITFTKSKHEILFIDSSPEYFDSKGRPIGKIWKVTLLGPKWKKVFKTKSQALRYAKAYMRKH